MGRGPRLLVTGNWLTTVTGVGLRPNAAARLYLYGTRSKQAVACFGTVGWTPSLPQPFHTLLERLIEQLAHGRLIHFAIHSAEAAEATARFLLQPQISQLGITLMVVRTEDGHATLEECGDLLTWQELHRKKPQEAIQLAAHSLRRLTQNRLDQPVEIKQVPAYDRVFETDLRKLYQLQFDASLDQMRNDNAMTALRELIAMRSSYLDSIRRECARFWNGARLFEISDRSLEPRRTLLEVRLAFKAWLKEVAWRAPLGTWGVVNLYVGASLPGWIRYWHAAGDRQPYPRQWTMSLWVGVITQSLVISALFGGASALIYALSVVVCAPQAPWLIEKRWEIWDTLTLYRRYVSGVSDEGWGRERSAIRQHLLELRWQIMNAICELTGMTDDNATAHALQHEERS